MNNILHTWTSEHLGLTTD